jgi:hypothetical protein
MVAGTMLPMRSWIGWPQVVDSQTPTETRAIWARAAGSAGRHQVDVIRTIDGDTFEALVHLWPGLDMTTRVRLRGIDTAEMKAPCSEELRLAKAASARLRDLLGEAASRSPISAPTNITDAWLPMSRRREPPTSQRRWWRAVLPAPIMAVIAKAGATARAGSPKKSRVSRGFSCRDDAPPRFDRLRS